MTLAGAENTLVAGAFRGTWRDLAPLPLPPAASVFCSQQLDALRAAWAHATTPRETLIAAASRLEPSLADELRGDGLAVVRASGDEVLVDTPTLPHDPEVGRLWLLTSGSTGRPKRVAHTLDSLTTVHGDQPARTWLCPYTPGAYAWWQVITLGLGLPGQSVVCVEPGRLDDWPEIALAEGVDAASGTPTFWRQALLRSGDTLVRVGLKQITLGGEPVDQGILDQLHAAFPEARISWIYASSEAGASIAVHDGHAGFPVAWLDAEPRVGRPRLSIDGEELLIASPNRADGMAAVLRTGDRAEVREGRVHITGRLGSDEINVGGSKVSASAVRDVLLAHPGVRWAAVKGRKAPLVGTVVSADVVSDADEADLARWCAERLPDFAVPRRFRHLAEIPLKESLKSDV